MNPAPLLDATADNRGAMTIAQVLELAGLRDTTDTLAAAIVALSGNTVDVSIGSPANGLSIVDQVLTLGAAGALAAGAMTTGAQILAGRKTFNGGVTIPSDVATLELGATSLEGNTFSGNIFGRYGGGSVSFALNTSTGAIKVGAGSLSTPALGPYADDNTGFKFPAGDTIDVVTGGQLRLQISSTGAALFQSAISMPTNTLFTIGGAQIYEDGSGHLNHTGTGGMLRSVGGYPAGGLTAGAPAYLGSYNGSSASALWLGVTQPSISGYAVLRYDGGGLNLNAPFSNSINFQHNGANIGSITSGGLLTLGTTLLNNGTSTLTKTGAPLHLYAAGGSGLYDTVRLVSNRQDSGLVCVSAGTELGAPVAGTILFQVAHSISTASSAAGNGTAFAKFMGSGDLDLTVAGQGVILTQPNGGRRRLTLDNAGALAISALL